MTSRREKFRRQMIEAGLEKPFRQSEFKRSPLLRCRKCGELVTEANVEKHLVKCQPLGSPCPKCGNTIMPNEFLNHLKTCIKVDVSEPKKVE